MTNPLVASIFSNPAFVAIPGVALGLIPALLAYRRGHKSDEIAKQAGIATTASGTIEQAFSGLRDLAEANRAALDDCRRELAASLQRTREGPP